MSLVPKDNSHGAQKNRQPAYGMHYRQGKPVRPASSSLRMPEFAQAAVAKGYQKANPAVELIRRKIDHLYAREPNVRDEMARTVVNQQPRPRSKHQQFMYDLSTSGKSLAQIQTEWHNYYIHLPDNEKHQVWQEFYQTASRQPTSYSKYVSSQQPKSSGEYYTPKQSREDDYPYSTTNQVVIADHSPTQEEIGSYKSTEDVRRELLEEVAYRGRPKLKAKHHLQSLAFGLGIGSIVILIFLFSFFNEVIIAPLIQPSRNDTNTPIILNTASVAPSSTPQVIIPKINVQIPVVYNDPSVNEADIENSLEDGVLHYPTTSEPGQLGNAAFFGHSSNNIFNSGKYKFAFVLLHTLVPGDIFYLTYNNQVYAYKVFNREVVSPSDVSVLNDVPGQQATATLITCDPPGTSINRLVVWGEQISPAPSTDGQPTQNTNPSQVPTELANDGPTLWGRFTNWLSGLL